MEPIAAPVPAPRSAPVPVREVVVVPQALRASAQVRATAMLMCLIGRFLVHRVSCGARRSADLTLDH
ncbi:hypothetical protein THIOKS12830011 [Thiocapsa sp. KS1]|nr:hypothetical protein THIOKS12830011 [Thiocapsa sp. KS1]